MIYKELEKYSDLEFLEKAYRKILNREIDETGKNYYLNFLRTGKRTKRQIITNILASPEANQFPKPKYFKLYLFWYTLYKIPIVEYIVRYIAVIFSLPLLSEKINKIDNNLSALEKKLNKEISNLQIDIEFKSKLKIEELLQIKTEIKDFKLYLQNITKPINIPKEIKDDKNFELFYLEFENKFRGSKVEIIQKLKKYIPFITKFTTPKVLDCGCGRGEWLEILEENNINAIGVDINNVFVEELKQNKLNAIEDDVLHFLSNNKGFDIITSFHLIEHLPLNSLLTFLKLSFEALNKNGMILLETPNPKNITVGACNFYTDPTHKNPIPPRTAKFMLEYVGFENVEIIPSKTDIGDFNEDWLNQPEDYAVIGYKR